MRALALMVLASCATGGGEDPPGPAFESVRDRLTTQPTRLFIPGEGSTGSLVAQRYTHDGWVAGTSPLTITTGELVAKVTGDQLTTQTFDISLAPIDLPDTIFGKPAQLVDVRVVMPAATSAAIAWTDADHATATVPMKIDLAQWSISIDGSATQLGAQHLGEIPLDIAFDGSGDQVATTLSLHAEGMLWNWADLVELTELDLSLAGATLAN